MNVLTILWAVRLLRRQPTRAMRDLAMTLSVVSVSQTAALFCRRCTQLSSCNQCVTSLGTMAAVYLLWAELGERSRMDQMLRLAEYDRQLRSMRAAVRAPQG